MELGLHGKVALVTAASRGLGLGCARALSQEGARVVLCARDPDTLEAAAAMLPGATLAVPADVTDPDTPRRLVDAAVDRFGGLDVLVANAGGPPPMRALDVDEAALASAINANLLTSIRLVQAAVPVLRRAPWGRICLLTSVSVKQPIPTLALSNTARTGLWGWAKTAATDLAPEGITLNLAYPGQHATDRARGMGLEGPAGDPDDFGKVVAFLCSQPAAFVIGAALQVDGAATTALL